MVHLPSNTRTPTLSTLGLAVLTLSLQGWAAVHALIHAKAKRDEHIVLFKLRIKDLFEDPPTLWPHSITIQPSNVSRSSHNRPNAGRSEIAYYRIALAGPFDDVHCEHPFSIDRKLTYPLYSDWVLIFVNLCLDGTKSLPIVQAKFDALLTTLDYMETPLVVPSHLGPTLEIGTELMVANDQAWMDELSKRGLWKQLGEENVRSLIELNLRLCGATREIPVNKRSDKYFIV